MLASASAKWDASSNQYSYLVRQATWLGIGIVVMTIMALLDYRILQKLTWPLFITVCIALILCYIPGIGDEAGGESRWIILPVIGRFQPSEPAKAGDHDCSCFMVCKVSGGDQKLRIRGFVIPSIILGRSVSIDPF